MSEASTNQDYVRLSDKILDALNLSLIQKDVEISEQLKNCLEMSMTRAAGGSEFVERREFSARMSEAFVSFDTLKKNVLNG